MGVKAFVSSKKNWITVILTIGLLCPFVFLDFPNGSLLTGKQDDFSFSDLYARMADKSATSRFSDDVVIVSIDGCPRDSLPSLIERLNSRGAATIGLDVIFKTRFRGDSTLIAAINSSHAPVVLAVRLEEKSNRTPVVREFRVADGPYFESYLSDSNVGAVNLAAYSVHGVIRSFAPSFYLGDDSPKKSMSHFAAELVRLYRSEAYDALKRRDDGQLVPIKFHQNDIDEFTWEEIMGPEDLGLQGKMVLAGYTSDVNDLKNTPLTEDMPGIMVQAKIVQTILDENYTTSTPETLSKVLALVLSFIFAWLLLYLSGIPEIGNLLSRLLQLALLLAIVFIGIEVFMRDNHYIDTFYVVLCIGLSQVCLDIVSGCVYLYLRLKNKK